MRNVLLGLLLTCLLLAPSANAQGLLRALHLKPTPYHTHFSAKKMTQLLEQRAAQSYQQALQATSLPQLWDKPCTRIAPALENPQQIYPHMERFLTTRQQWDNYILSSYNRRIQTYSTRLEQFLKQLTDRFYELYFAQHVVRVPQEQAMARLALQVPADTQYLLVGETHTDFIRDYVGQLISQLRATNPQREIILLTEFAQDSPVKYLSERYAPVWDAAQAARIPIVGLEPEFVEYNQFVCARGSSGAFTFWATLEGIALRNRHWADIIARYRKQFPDALFIVHAGSGHLGYMEPYSLAKQFNGAHPFVVLLEGPTQPSDFDIMSNGAFPDRVLRFTDKKLSRIAGFDIQLRATADNIPFSTGDRPLNAR